MLAKGDRFFITVMLSAFFLATVFVTLILASLTHDNHTEIKSRLPEVNPPVDITAERCGVIVFTNIIVEGDSSDMPICLLTDYEGEMFLWNGADPTVHMTITFKREIDIPFN